MTLLLAAACLVSPLTAQTWNWLSLLTAPGDESISHLAPHPTGMVWSGTFTENMELGGMPLDHTEDADMFLATSDAEGEITHARAFGGPSDNLPAALLTSTSGHILLAGSFWGELRLLDTLLQVPNDQKALFIAAFAEPGRLAWVQTIQGTGLKELTDLEEGPEGHFYASGYFGGALQVEDQSLLAAGRNDLFVLSLTPEGRLRWMTRAGQEGNTRAIAMAVGPGGELFLGGYFDHTALIGPDTLTANTLDRDVFLARYTPEGEPVWARKAGGVHDDELVDIDLDEEGQVLATGFLVGVMTLSDTISIQSSTGLSDFFLIRYDAAGTPLAGRAYGGPEVQQPADLQTRNGRMTVCGTFQGDMTIDGTTLSAGGGFSSFVATFEADLTLASILGATTSEAFFLRALLDRGDDQWIVGGTSQGGFRAGDLLITETDGYDMVLAEISNTTTLTTEPGEEGGNRFHFYPNPATERVTIQCEATDYQVSLYAQDGKLLGQYRNPNQIGLNGLAAGSYWLQCREPNRVHWRKLIIH